MFLDPYVCARCGVRKRESNHWYMVRIINGQCTVRHWSKSLAHIPAWKHACGRGCVSRMLEGYFDRLENPAPDIDPVKPAPPKAAPSVVPFSRRPARV